MCDSEDAGFLGCLRLTCERGALPDHHVAQAVAALDQHARAQHTVAEGAVVQALGLQDTRLGLFNGHTPDKDNAVRRLAVTRAETKADPPQRKNSTEPKVGLSTEFRAPHLC